MQEKIKNKSTVAGVVFTGFLFIGLALGILFGETVVGILLGMGLGFVAMGVIYAIAGKQDPTDEKE